MKHLVLTLALLPSLVMAHNIKESAEVPLVNIADKGELVLKGKEISYQPWQSKVLAGKVFLIQHIAGRTSAKELNGPMIEAIKGASCPTTSTRPSPSSTAMTPSGHLRLCEEQRRRYQERVPLVWFGTGCQGHGPQRLGSGA